MFGKRTSLVLAVVLAFSMVLNGLAFAADNGENVVERIGEPNYDRYETAAAIAEKKYDAVDTVVIAQGQNEEGDEDFADGLAASVLAGALDAPILLTQQNVLSENTKKALERLKPQTAYIAGGPVAVSDEVEGAIEELGIDIERVEGYDRYETAINLADAAGVKGGTAYIVNGEASADAMVAGAAAYLGKGIIVPVKKDTILDKTMAAIKRLAITNAVIVGGDKVVSDSVTEELEAEGITVDRAWGGEDTGREQTSVDFAETQFDEINGLTIVNGHDGLADAVGASALGNPILYASNADNMKDEVADFVKEVLAENPTTPVTIVGGPKVVSPALQGDVQQIVDEANAELMVVAAEAINSKTIRVTLNKAAEELTADDFTVKNSETNFQVIVDDVKADGTTVTLDLASSLENEAEYTVSVSESDGVPFTYEQAEPVSVTIDRLVVPKENFSNEDSYQLKATVHDADGNDITPDYDLNWTSPADLVDEDGKITGELSKTDAFLVKVDVVDDEGNTIISSGHITIKTEKAKVATFNGYHVGDGLPEKPEDYVHQVQESDIGTTLYVDAKDQFGREYNENFTFESLNPEILVADASEGTLTPIQEGTARVKISDANSKWSTVVEVEVVADAKLERIELDKDSVEVVAGSDIGQEVTVKLFDQYNEPYQAEEIKITSANEDVASVAPIDSSGGDSATFTIKPGKEIGTTEVTVEADDKKKTVNVLVVEKGTLAGYEVVTATGESGEVELNKDDTVQLKAYAIDNNGRRIADVTNDAAWSSYEENVAQVGNDEGENKGLVTAQGEGTATITGKLHGTVIGTIDVTVVDATPELAAITFKGNSFKVKNGDNIAEKIESLISSMKDQFDKNFEIEEGSLTDYIDNIVSSDNEVLSIDDYKATVDAQEETTVTLTVKFDLADEKTLVQVFYVTVSSN